jgi:hypothetical protein
MPHDPALPVTWRKSSASATGDCVEVAICCDAIFVRDSKQRHAHVLEFTFSEWNAFLSGVRQGEFEIEHLEASGALVARDDMIDLPCSQ